MTSKIVILVMLGIVALILFSGIAVMAIGGETSRKWSNVLMRWRVVAQAVAILVVLLTVYLASSH
jgi:hypothetical protein